MGRMICQCCGEALHKHGDVYECGYCGATYRDDQAEKAAGLLKGLLDDFKLEQLSNARRRLYETTHEKYPSSQAVTQAAGAVLSISPDDFMARMYLRSHDSDPHELISLLSRGNVSEWEAKETVDWLVRSLDMRTLAAVKDFADRHLKGTEKTGALNRIEDEAFKLDSGVYDLSLKRDVFLCYSTDDMPRVIEVMEAFEENALSCFAAFRNLRHGKGAQENYQEAIFRAMKNCRVFVFLSSNSSRDPHRKGVAEELEHLVSDLPKKPRVEFLLEDYPERMPILAKRRLEEAFPHLEYCREPDDLIVRVSGLLDAEENAERERARKIAEEASERAKKELQAEFEAREAARKEEQAREREQQAKRQKELEERLAKEREEQAKRQKELEERLRLEREEQAKRQKELEERLSKEKEERERRQRELEEERLRIEKEKLEIEKRRIESEKGSPVSPAGGAMDAESMLAMMEKAEELKRKRAEEAADRKKAEPVADAIKAIGKVEFTPECRERIDTARAYYSRLTEGQRAFVHNADALLTAEREYKRAEEAADKKKAEAAADAIEAIGEVELTPECRERIDTARACYSGLTEAQRAHVHNADVLLTAEREYKRAEEEADRKKAEAADDAIKAIGSVEYSPKCKARIDAARKAYDALTTEQRASVHNAEILQRAERWYAKLEDEAAKPIEAVFEMGILPDGNASVAKCRDKKITKAAIPEHYRGKAVTSIGDFAFSDCSSLKSITIPSSVTSIGRYAFEVCKSLISITIPESVASIGDFAFRDCSSLTSITIPESVTSIGEWAFWDCESLTSITIPKSVASIGEKAFKNCSLLAKNLGLGVDLMETIDIDELRERLKAFAQARNKENASKAEKAIKTIGTVECSTECKSRIDEAQRLYDALSEQEKALVSNYGALASARAEYEKLKAEELKRKRAEEAADKKKAGAVVDAIEAIGGVEYSPKCKARIDVARKAYDALTMEQRAFVHNAEILQRAEHEYANAEKEERGRLDKEKEDAAKSIEAIFDMEVLPDGNASVAKCRDKKIIEAAIPEHYRGKAVTTIGEEAFRECKSLTSIIIPDSVTRIGRDAFYNCPSLKSIKVDPSNPKFDSRGGCNAIVETKTNALFLGCVNTAIPESVTSIGWRAFNGCLCLSSIALPDNVTSIGEEAFSDCAFLTSITIPGSVTSIGNGTFHGCRSLTSIVIPNNVTTIGEKAFLGCSSLTSITIPESVTSIGERAFYDCFSLKSIVIPESVTFIGGGAFCYCRSLKSIAIPSGVTSIDGAAFSYCKSLASITVPSGVISIGGYAFNDCESLTSIVIPEGVTSIGDGAFNSCKSLTSITIPSSVTSIGKEAFAGCSCAIRFAHKKPLLGYPKGFAKQFLEGFKGKAFWGGK